VAVAQSTAEIDWKNVELRVFSSDGAPVTGIFSLPGEPLRTLRLAASGPGFSLAGDPLGGAVRWRVTRAPAEPPQ
jgi:alpha-D-xyloside xylohydrolase